MKYILLAITILLSSHTYGDQCATMVPYGDPEVTMFDTYRLCRKAYVLVYSADRKTPVWVAERLEAKNMKGNEQRINAFKPDPNLPKEAQATTEDYRKSGYDRGHQAPAGNMHTDAEAMLESFYLSNMVPQVPENNRVIWKSLEEKTRELAIARKNVFVITGPIYEGEIKTIGKNRVAVPTKLYKILVDTKMKAIKVFIIPNARFEVYELPRFISTLDEVERLTGIKFFPTLEEPITESSTMWGRSSN